MSPLECTATILKFWLSLEPWWQDRLEPPETRAALYEPVAAIVCASTENPTERAMLGVQAYWEGARLARYVLEERCKDGPRGARCDEGLATGPWQVHRWCRLAWNKATSHATRLEAGARCALQAARSGRRACGGIKGMFAYQSSMSCSRLPPGTNTRISMTYHLLGELSAPTQ